MTRQTAERSRFALDPAREALVEAEIDLRRRIEAVAQRRRELPRGPQVDDYVFTHWVDGAPAPVRLSELFAPDKPSLVIYSFMFATSPCPSCSSILDGLDGAVRHIKERVNFAAVAKAPIDTLEAYRRHRGWRHLPILSSHDNRYNVDFRAENASGAQMPMLNVFEKVDDSIHYFYGTHMLYAPSDPGQEPRHVDFLWPIWSVFDVTREGRGEDWEPQTDYAR